jgi:cyclopropane fatty-acyl-phospholipid synthase-like methyltransferase
MHLSDYFERGSLWKTVLKRHPYDFVETYALLRQLAGYERYYVNLGYWRDGPTTTEAGWELVRLLAEKMELCPGASLLDAGSGLGQAAVDLAEAYELSRVLGLNINPRQVRFANDLAAERGLTDVITHRLGDACALVHELEAASWDFAMAVECIGHFAEPARFLDGVTRALAPGGRLAFCLNIADVPPAPLRRATMQLSYGFVPASAAAWRDRVEAAGLSVVDEGDLTEAVLQTSMQRALDELNRLDPAAFDLTPLRRWITRRAFAGTLRMTREARLAYRYFVVEKAP